MRILIGLAILVTLALLASGRRFWALRRTRLGAALLTGGWLMVGVGMLIGPHGVRLVLREQLMDVRPLILFVLGWVGLMLGLQADRRLPKMIPTPVLGLAVMDVAVSVALFGLVAWGVLRMRESGGELATLPPALLIGACAVGWSAEVRSLQRGRSGGDRITAVIRASAGVASILAVVVYGLGLKSFVIEAGEGVVGLSAARFGMGVGMSVLIAVAMGLMGKWLSAVVPPRREGEAEFLVVLLGLVSFTAGAAATLNYSPLFVALLTGAVVVNLPGKPLMKFQQVIIGAEQPVAMALMLVAGVLADPRIGLTGWVLVGAGLLLRAVWKFGVVRLRMRVLMRREGASPIFAGLMRQSPLAIALAVGYAISVEGRGALAPLSGEQVLMVVILIGLAAEAWPFLHRFGHAQEEPQGAGGEPKTSGEGGGRTVTVTDHPTGVTEGKPANRREAHREGEASEDREDRESRESREGRKDRGEGGEAVGG